ncbi:hypothetical protein AMTR_s00041p00236600 [Amborella trichopoda]|uniref:Uncharacterized protein n=1 Tax=Amborella trichopoda TaxID=13333 RepID=W1PYX0_AMBTC|nr:hypothetical protein AMTR_s00041p00236600 [Amborella trichopoda]
MASKDVRHFSLASNNSHHFRVTPTSTASLEAGGNEKRCKMLGSSADEKGPFLRRGCFLLDHDSLEKSRSIGSGGRDCPDPYAAVLVARGESGRE